jgi:translation initiation factor IF-2
VAVPRGVAQLAAQAGVPVAESPIIYQLMDDVKARVVALLPTIRESRVAGEAAVLQLFDIHGKGKQTMRVAGCRVTNGVLAKDKAARVVRDGTVLFTGTCGVRPSAHLADARSAGPVDTMRHLKRDVMEVRKGMECGLSVRGFDDFREGDTLQFIEIVEKPGQL